MNKKNICFIRPVEKGNAYWQEAVKQYGFHAEIPYKDYNIILRLLREICFYLGFPKKIWFNKKIDRITADIYIVKDPLMCIEYLKWLRKKKPNARIILDYDNRVFNSLDPDLVKDKSIEKWTYDPDDARQYNMHIKPSSYFDCFRIDYDKRQTTKDYDIVYVGRDKGRADHILSLERKFRSLGVRTYFHICPTRTYKRYLKKYYKPVITYKKYLDIINRSRAILNIMPDGQKSLTMRDFEAVFDEIKCITNNKGIKEFELYDRSRFFILGEDNISELKDFLYCEFKPIDDTVLEKYYFCNALNKMIAM